MMKRQIQIIIRGRVQGVYYRASMKQKAEELGVTGWVRNEPDSSVYAEAEGDDNQLQALIDWCRKGPPAARVDEVEVRPGQQPSHTAFSIRRKLDIRIRLARYEDLPAIHALVGELAAYEQAEDEFVAGLEEYQRDFDAGYFEVLVAEDPEGGILGMALYYLTYSTWKGKMLYLEDFIVRESHRRKGIGQQLFEAFLEEARKKECRLVKWQVLDWNEPALDFYRKNEAVIEQNWWNGKIFLRT